LVEILAKNKAEAEKAIRPPIKKIGGAFERGIINIFQRKGAVVVKAPEIGQLSGFIFQGQETILCTILSCLKW
jgi:transcriptional/translational regulatory protein YebC/TACO1